MPRYNLPPLPLRQINRHDLRLFEDEAQVEIRAQGYPEWFFLTSGRKNCIEGCGKEINYLNL